MKYVAPFFFFMMLSFPAFAQDGDFEDADLEISETDELDEADRDALEQDEEALETEPDNVSDSDLSTDEDEDSELLESASDNDSDTEEADAPVSVVDGDTEYEWIGGGNTDSVARTKQVCTTECGCQETLNAQITWSSLLLGLFFASWFLKRKRKQP